MVRMGESVGKRRAVVHVAEDHNNGRRYGNLSVTTLTQFLCKLNPQRIILAGF